MTKGRISKKLVAIATTILLLATMAIPAMAAPSLPDTGTITVHKFARNSVGTPHPDNMYSGEALAPAIVATLGTPLNGAGFTLYRLDMTAVNTAIAGGLTVASYAPLGATDVNFTMSDSTVILATGTVVVGEQFTAGAGTTSFGSGALADGYYLLVETTSPGAQYTPSAPSVIKTPLTLNDGSGENRDIHVYPKNVDDTAPIVEKTMSGGVQLVNTYDVVPFKISTLFKNTETGADAVGSVFDLENAGTYGSVVIDDQLAAYFTYIDTLTPVTLTQPAGTRGVEVYLVDGGGSKIGGVNLTAGTHYNLTGITAGTPGPGANIVVTLTNAGIDEAIAENAEALVVEFDTVYTGGASAAADATVVPVTNIANSTITAPGGATPTPTPGPFYAPGAAIIVDKTDNLTAKFQGATFALSRVAVPTVVYDEATWTASGYTAAEVTALEAEYVLDSTGKPVSATTNANGEVIFNNVPYTDTGITYYLKETSTQAGYELPVGTIAVVLDSKADLITAGSPLLDSVTNDWLNGSTVAVTTTIMNNPLGTDQSFSLPLTGGAGTMLFTAVGIIVMIGAAVIYLHGKKRNA